MRPSFKKMLSDYMSEAPENYQARFEKWENLTIIAYVNEVSEIVTPAAAIKILQLLPQIRQMTILRELYILSKGLNQIYQNREK